jgi:hypothetical protein
MTRQETSLLFNPLEAIDKTGDNEYEITYAIKPHQTGKDWAERFL